MSPIDANKKNKKTRRLAEAELLIHSGDLLLFRKPGLISRIGRGLHSHAAKAAWWDKELMCVEVRERVGGRAVTLRSQVEKYPDRIDVYETNPGDYAREYERKKSTAYMRTLCGQSYGYWPVLLAALRHLPFVRLLVKPGTDDEEKNKGPMFCSQACAAADRAGGYDPVRSLSDRLTEPTDLARSPFYKYQCTLEP
jgi:hypothetical protein